MLFGNLGIDKNSNAIGLFLFFIFFPLFFFLFKRCSSFKSSLKSAQ